MGGWIYRISSYPEIETVGTPIEDSTLYILITVPTIVYTVSNNLLNASTASIIHSHLLFSTQSISSRPDLSHSHYLPLSYRCRQHSTFPLSPLHAAGDAWKLRHVPRPPPLQSTTDTTCRNLLYLPVPGVVWLVWLFWRAGHSLPPRPSPPPPPPPPAARVLVPSSKTPVGDLASTAPYRSPHRSTPLIGNGIQELALGVAHQRDRLDHYDERLYPDLP